MRNFLAKAEAEVHEFVEYFLIEAAIVSVLALLAIPGLR
jgi:hypothetical protein